MQRRLQSTAKCIETRKLGAGPLSEKAPRMAPGMASGMVFADSSQRYWFVWRAPVVCLSWVLLISALHPLAALQERSHRHGARLGGVLSEHEHYAHFDVASAQNVGLELQDGHSRVSTFWTLFIQRAAQAEIAVRINKAHKDAERHLRSRWFMAKGTRKVLRSSRNPVVIADTSSRFRVYWSQYLNGTLDLDSDRCKVPCRWETDQSKILDASVLLYTPLFDPMNGPPQKHRKDQVVAMASIEALFVLHVQAMDKVFASYDMLVSMSRHSDVIISYADGFLEILKDDGREQEKFEAANPLPQSFLEGQRGDLATFISGPSCYAGGALDSTEKYIARNRLIADLTGLNMTFDHYGTCKFGTEAHASALPAAHREEWGVHSHGIEGQRRKVQILKQYKFVLGLENTIEMDYLTEKFYQLYAARRLPIYLGAPNAAAYAPPKSFINVLEHSPTQLVELLKHLDSNDASYQKYFDWRLSEDETLLPYFSAIPGATVKGYRGDGMDWVCKLCVLYHEYYDWLE